MRRLFSILLLFSLSFAACVGEVNMSLPAVSDGSGVLVGITMRGIPGTGMEYVGASPTVGTSTQESLVTAAFVARGLSMRGEDCDLLVKVSDEDSPGGVEGPSAGAAFMLMAYSLLTGEEMSHDATITGAIGDGGEILPVGGLYEKALSAKIAGVESLVTPLQTVEEKLMLRGISGVDIYEVSNATEAIEFFFYGVEPEERPLDLEVEPLENITPYEGEKAAGMDGIVAGMIGSEMEAASRIEDQQVREYFEARAEQHEELERLGYEYAAANGAFLTGISASAIAEVAEPDIAAKKEEVQSCLDSLEEPNATTANYQWIMGGEAREMRARRNYEKYVDIEPETKDEEYLLVYQMGYSKAWCEAAKAMYAVESEEGGDAVDGRKLRNIAEGLLNYTDDYGDWAEYAQAGQELYDEGKYAGAIYELEFAKSMVEGDDALEAGATDEDYALMMENESTSVWGRVFRGHSEYMEKTGSHEDAYRMIVFARNMDAVAEEVGADEAPPMEPVQRGESICLPAFVLLGALGTALCAGSAKKLIME
ncbi:MAG: S16 family serine protease [Candidatus Micrarchaeia archaeon]|jgi:predicted S18 family serine protease